MLTHASASGVLRCCQDSPSPLSPSLGTASYGLLLLSHSDSIDPARLRLLDTCLVLNGVRPQLQLLVGSTPQGRQSGTGVVMPGGC